MEPNVDSTPSAAFQSGRSTRKPHPRVFVAACGTTIFITLMLHSILTLYPSYASGIYRSAEPSQETFVVPFYSDSTFGSYDSSFSIWTINTFVELFTLFFFPPLSLALLIVLIRQRHRFTRREQMFWSTVMTLVWLAFVGTLPAAMKFADWVAD